MLAVRASLLSHALSIHRDGHRFDSPPPLSFSSTSTKTASSKTFAATSRATNDRTPSVRRILWHATATTSETNNTVASSEEGEGQVLASSKEGEGEGEGSGSGSNPTEMQVEEYEVVLEKPIGLKFYKGPERGTYIDAIAPGGNADKTKMFTVGDKVIATSAVFGTEIWPAAEYGRTMYTIRQRIGPLLMRMQKRYGNLESAAIDEKGIIEAERNSGVISDKVREIQMQNYLRKMELKKKRETELTQGLKLYKEGKYEAALESFESVLGSKPEPREAAVTSYNVACCYSQLNQIEAGLSALEDAMEAGYEDYQTIRTDPDIANLRSSEKFKPLLDKYDEPFINENAINAIKSLFGFNKK